MNALDCTTALAEPIGTIGMSFYFSPQAIAIGETIELDVVTFYAAGRGGVLGDIDVIEVDEAFFFFKDGMVAAMMEKARAGADRDLAVTKHLEAAEAFANATFGGVATDVLDAFSAATSALVGTLPTGSWPIVDGYRALPIPSGSAAAAYHFAVILREIRGGVHTDAIKAEGLSDVEAVQLYANGSMLGLHGYTDADTVEETPELVARRAAAETDTDVRMAGVLEVLSDAQRDALVAGSNAMFAALAAPVAVA